MNIKMVAKQCAAHGGTFNVPTRTAIAPGRGPGRFAGFGMLPQHEVQRVFFGARYGHALASTQIVQRFARELAVPFKLTHGEIHIAITP